MVCEKSEKIHIIVRRNFESDLRRHFVGEVVAMDGALAKVIGYTFVLDIATGQFVRRSDKRIRIIGLDHPGNIINVLPREADIESAHYKMSPEGKLVITDGKNFTLDINEFGFSR